MSRFLNSLATGALLGAFFLGGTAAAQLRIDVPSGEISDDGFGAFVGGRVYVLLGPIRIPAGKTLTIRPGAIVKLPSRRSINVFGTLRCGEAGKSRVVLTDFRDDSVGGDTNGDLGNTTPAPGGYFRTMVQNGGVAFFANTEHRFGRGMGVNAGGTLNATDLTIQKARDVGLDGSSGAFFKVDGLTVEDVAGEAITDIPIIQAPNFTRITTRRCTIGELRLTGNNTVSEDTRLDINNSANGSGVFHATLGVRINVAAGKKLTLGPGVIMKGAGIDVTINGELDCLGTRLRPVTWTDFRDDTVGGDGNATNPGAGNAIRTIIFNDGSDNSRWTHTRVRFTGRGGGPALRFTRSTAKLEECTIERSASDAFFADVNSAASFVRCRFVDNPGIPGELTIKTLARCAGNIAERNAKGDYFHMEHSAAGISGFGKVTITSDMYPGPVLVYHAGAVRCVAGDELSFAPGTIVKSLFGDRQTVAGGKLNILGTTQEPVIFTRLDDDSVGGDTTKKCNTSLGGGAVQFHWQSTADTSLAENFIVRRPLNNAITCDSNKVTLRNIRLERLGRRGGFNVSAAAGNAIDNVLVDGCSTGIFASRGNVSYRHATITGATSRGISAGSSWRGSIISSIFFGNGTNVSGVPLARFVRSNGAFDGQSGNIVADPKFRDAPNGDFRLMLGSPCVDSGDPATIVAADIAGFPRPQDGDNNASFVPDMGAHELASTGLNFRGAPLLGTAPTLDVWGKPVSAILILGTLDGQFFFPGIGQILAGTASLQILGPIPADGTKLPFPLPNDTSLDGVRFGLQALTIDAQLRLRMTNGIAQTLRRG